MPDQNVIELRWIVKVIQRWWWLILGCAVLAGVAALIFSKSQTPEYQATTTLYVQLPQDTRSNEYNLITAGERLAVTYSQLVKSLPVLETVIDELDLDATIDSLSERIRVEPISSTQLIRVSITNESPEIAAQIANSIAKAFALHVETLQEERYNASLIRMQNKMDELQRDITATDLELNTLRTNLTKIEVEKSSQENILEDYQINQRLLQQQYETIDMTIAQSVNQVNITEKAHILPNRVLDQYIARTRIMLPSGFQGATYSQMVKSPENLNNTISKLNIEYSTDTLGNIISVEQIPNTQLIQIQVIHPTPELAVNIADTISTSFTEQINHLSTKPYTDRLAELQIQIDELSTKIEQSLASVESLTSSYLKTGVEITQMEKLLTEYRDDFRTYQRDYEQVLLRTSEAAESVLISEPAAIPSEPAQNTWLYVAIAILVGLLGGFGLAFLLEYLDDRIRSSEDVDRILGLSTLGSIGEIEENLELVVYKEPRMPVSESFRVLSTNVRLSGIDKPTKTILISSPTAKEGKSIIVANLAVSLARSGLSVVAVDADLRIPRLDQIFELNTDKGLTESILESSTNGFIQDIDVEGLSVLTSGVVPPNPAEVIGSQSMKSIIQELSSKFDMVLIDSPPVLPVADTPILASQADGVLLVLRSGSTRNQHARDALHRLRQVGAPILGVVLNDVPGLNHSYYKYYGNDKKELSRVQQLWEHVRSTVIEFFRYEPDQNKINEETKL